MYLIRMHVYIYKMLGIVIENVVAIRLENFL